VLLLVRPMAMAVLAAVLAQQQLQHQHGAVVRPGEALAAAGRRAQDARHHRLQLLLLLVKKTQERTWTAAAQKVRVLLSAAVLLLLLLLVVVVVVVFLLVLLSGPVVRHQQPLQLRPAATPPTLQCRSMQATHSTQQHRQPRMRAAGRGAVLGARAATRVQGPCL
jgi:hypothetical protein